MSVAPQKLHARNGYEIDILDANNAVFSRNGEAIGHLVFDYLSGPSRQRELIDYDGVFNLPKPIAEALRAHGVHVDTTFD